MRYNDNYLAKYEGLEYRGIQGHKHWLCKKCRVKNDISRNECIGCGTKKPKIKNILSLKRPKASIRRKAFEKKHPELYGRY